MSSQQPNVINVFCSYSDEDRADLYKLEKQLASLVRTGSIRFTGKHKITPGQERQREIDAQIEEARLILLLISSNFISSNDCYAGDLVKALQRRRDDNVVVVPIILKPCTWDDLAFSGLQVLPRDKAPVSLCRNRDEAFDQIVREIKVIVDDLRRYGRDYMEPLLPTAGDSKQPRASHAKPASQRSLISQATDSVPVQKNTRSRKPTHTLADTATVAPSKKYAKSLPRSRSRSEGTVAGRLVTFFLSNISGNAFTRRCKRWKGNSAWLLFFYAVLDLVLLPFLLYQQTHSAQWAIAVFCLSALLFIIGVINQNDAIGLPVALLYIPVWIVPAVWCVNTYLHLSWPLLTIFILIVSITAGRLSLFQWQSPFGQR